MTPPAHIRGDATSASPRAFHPIIMQTARDQAWPAIFSTFASASAEAVEGRNSSPTKPA